MVTFDIVSFTDSGGNILITTNGNHGFTQEYVFVNNVFYELTTDSIVYPFFANPLKVLSFPNTDEILVDFPFAITNLDFYDTTNGTVSISGIAFMSAPIAYDPFTNVLIDNTVNLGIISLTIAYDPFTNVLIDNTFNLGIMGMSSGFEQSGINEDKRKYNFAKTTPISAIPAKLVGYDDDELNVNREDTSIASKGEAINNFYDKTTKLNWTDGTDDIRKDLPLIPLDVALNAGAVATVTDVIEVGYEVEVLGVASGTLFTNLIFSNAAPTLSKIFINGYETTNANAIKHLNSSGRTLLSFRFTNSYTGQIQFFLPTDFKLYRDYYAKQ
jgi:hypothetical protein